jgi:hypothetical protein
VTRYEWFQAQRFGDEYYLYVFFNSALRPELLVIGNPFANLDAAAKVELVGYFVDMEQMIERSRTNLYS